MHDAAVRFGGRLLEPLNFWSLLGLLSKLLGVAGGALGILCLHNAIAGPNVMQHEVAEWS